MISSTSTLFLAVLVMTNSVFAAPLRLPVVDAELTARADTVPEVAPRAPRAVVDVQPLRKRSTLGLFSRRSARLDTRDLLEEVEPPVARAVDEDATLVRRFPRRALYERLSKRDVTPPPVLEERAPRPRVYPRRAYYEKYEDPDLQASAVIKETIVVKAKLSEDLAAHYGSQVPPSQTGQCDSSMGCNSMMSPSATGTSTMTDSTPMSTMSTAPSSINDVNGGTLSTAPMSMPSSPMADVPPPPSGGSMGASMMNSGSYPPTMMTSGSYVPPPPAGSTMMASGSYPPTMMTSGSYVAPPPAYPPSMMTSGSYVAPPPAG